MKLFCIVLLVMFSFLFTEEPKTKQPNVVIIFLDDSGWSDFEPFGNSLVNTPNVQQLAEEGRMYTNFYLPQAICSASRASLLTGSYPGRTKVFGAHGPRERGLDTIFPTMGEIFTNAGYKTALFGKWHLGDQVDTRPHKRGFQETSGLLYSNDMWKKHPVNPEYWGKYPLQYFKNGEVFIADVTENDQRNLTKWYTEDAVNFIERNKNNPFLLYVPHSMPHVPIFCSDEFSGKSGLGLYGDVIMELDWSVGQINKALKDNGLEENTIVVFSSDNGPWSVYGNHAGKTPFREAKATSFDGGIRTAAIIKYPGQIKPNTKSDFAFFSIDLLPSLCNILNISLQNNEIDGLDIWNNLTGKAKSKNPHNYYAISTNDQLEAILSADGRWKLHLPHNFRTVKTYGKDGLQGTYVQDSIGPVLYDLKMDPLERINVIGENKKIADLLLKYSEKHLDKFYRDNTK